MIFLILFIVQYLGEVKDPELGLAALTLFVIVNSNIRNQFAVLIMTFPFWHTIVNFDLLVLDLLECSKFVEGDCSRKEKEREREGGKSE